MAVRVTLFTALFASQGALIAMSPVLAEAASDLHVSIAAAGQLRTVTGVAAGLTALLLGAAAARLGLARLLLVGSGLLALGSLASAAAPSYALLAVAQLPVGIAVAVLMTSAVLAAAEWVPYERQTQTLSWALVGQPAAWIVGMPLIGVVGEHSWRDGWLVVPFVAAVAAGLLVAPRARLRPPMSRPSRARAALADRALRRWLAAELLANAAWAGTLVYAGALFVDSFGTATKATGFLLAIAAGAYVAGNLACRRLAQREPRRVLVGLMTLLALADALFGLERPDVATSTALFSGAAFLAGGRTLVASAFVLATSADVRPALASLRVSSMQFGYFVGSIAGGAALALGGYGALGTTMGLLFMGAAGVLLWRSAPERAQACSASA